MGWIIHRHGVLYAEEYGLDMTFEALVARIAAGFIENFDARRERCWIAERDGEIVGSVLLINDNEDIAKLRLLDVEPMARGLGIGTPARRGVYPFRAPARLSQDHIVDERRADLGAPASTRPPVFIW